MTAHHQDLLAEDLGRMDIPEAAAEVGLQDHLVVVVRGKVIGQGSKKMVPGNRFINDNDKTLRPWRVAVKHAAIEAMDHMHPDTGRPLFGRGVPVGVTMTFTFARPQGHFGTGRNAGVLKATAPREYIGFPDADKAVRAIFDSCTEAGVWADDKQAVHHKAIRTYPGVYPDALDIPGVVIRIRALTP